MAAKKKVRVYKDGGAYQYYCGGSTHRDTALSNKQQGGQPAMTQDSQQDISIPQEKVNKFAEWLRNTSQQAVSKRDFDQELDLIRQVAQRGYSVPDSSAQNYGRMDDPNLRAFQSAYDNSIVDWVNPIEMMTQPQGDMQINFVDPNNTKQPPTNAQPILDQNTNSKLNRFTRDLTNKAQQGQSIPGYDIYNTAMFDGQNADITSLPREDFRRQMQEGIPQTKYPNPDDMVSQSNTEFTKEPDYSTYSSQENNNNQRGSNPYLNANLAIGSMQLIGNIANMDERAARERDVNERVSNVHRIYGAQGPDRGDYMTNVPGVGDFLKPDEHVRSGYNTKIAQDGTQIGNEAYQVNQEVDLNREEIERLIAQGYQIEYLD